MAAASIAALGLFAATPASAQTFSGTFSASNDWFRFNASCAPEASARMVDWFGIFPRDTGSYTFTARRPGGATVAIDVYTSFSAETCLAQAAIGTSGSGTATVTVNVTDVDRPLTLVVSSGTTSDVGSYTVEVSSAPGAGVDGDCQGTGTLSPTSESVAKAGLAGIPVTYTPPAGVACSGYIIDRPAWISGLPITASGAETFVYSVAPNGGGPRTGSIRIGQRTHTVHQDGTCNYDVSTSNVLVSGAGGTFFKTLTVNSGCGWGVGNANSWIATDTPTGEGAQTIAFTVAPNDGGFRTGTLMIAGHSIVVQQYGRCEYILADSAIDLGATGSVETVTVSSGVGCPLTGASDVPWILPLDSGVGDDTADTATRFEVGANTGPARSGTITLGDEALVVHQASGCAVTLPFSSRKVPALYQASSFTVQTDDGCDFTVTSDATWLTSTPGDGAVDFEVEASTGATRVGHLEVKSTSTSSSAIYTVTQEGGCIPSIASGGEARGAGASEGSFGFTLEAGCDLSVSVDVDWIDASVASDDVAFAVLANEGPARTGTITLGDEVSYAITQASGCAVEVDQASVTLEPSGDDIDVGLIAGDGCTVTATAEGAPWLITTVGPGGVTIAGDENLGGPRSADVTLTAEETGATATVHVTQSTAIARPIIVAQPMSERAYVGEDITFTVGVEGEATSLRWRKDGRDIPGETGSSLTLTELELEDAGRYDVVASNVAGSAFSKAAVLEVSARPAGGCSATSSSSATAWPLAALLLALFFALRGRRRFAQRRGC